MTKRSQCPTCHYPLATCVCHATGIVESRHNIVILQHPSETKQAKGTVNLLKLCLPQLQVWLGETPADFEPLRHQLQNDDQTTYLVYPSEQSQPLEAIADKHETTPKINLIFIDGSWKKAYKIFQLNPWLAALPALHFSHAPRSQYLIRKASRSDSLSTLEAVDYCLTQLDDCDTTPLLNSFKAMIDGQWRYMSDEVKQRY